LPGASHVSAPEDEYEPQQEELLQRGDLKLFLSARRVEVDGQEVVLTPIEFNLLRCLAQRPEQP